MTIIELEAHRHTITTPQGPVSCIDVGSSTSPSICLTWAQTSITSLDGRSRHPLRRPPGDVTDICCHGSNRGAPSRHTRYSGDRQGSNDHEGEKTMARARHSVDIARPIEDVFDFLANGANNPRWQKRVTSTTQLGDTLGVGTAFKQSMRHPLGFSVPASYRITAFERPRRLATTGTSGGPSVRPRPANSPRMPRAVRPSVAPSTSGPPGQPASRPPCWRSCIRSSPGRRPGWTMPVTSSRDPAFLDNHYRREQLRHGPPALALDVFLIERDLDRGACTGNRSGKKAMSESS